MSCVARVVRAILGPSAIADAKLECAASLVVLGIQVDLSSAGMRCVPSADKVAKWRAALRKARATGVLAPGQASKLAGGLSWGASHMFHRLGRAMLRPLFKQSHS